MRCNISDYITIPYITIQYITLLPSKYGEKYNSSVIPTSSIRKSHARCSIGPDFYGKQKQQKKFLTKVTKKDEKKF